MILKSFLLGNLVSLCMKIINSVVVVGLYYGFLTTFSIGPSYLFLLRAQVMEEREEGTEKKVSAITGFITGQLMMFISIYYAPLHLALGRPHTITVLALPYLLFHFFWNNHKNFLVYGSTTRNSMRNLSIQCIFLNNIIFQFFNHFILPSSMLARLVNIFMFRCNNKMLFVTSSFFGWLIGHILFMKWIVLVLVWIGENHSIRSNVLIRFNKYIMSKLINFMARIFSILLFITCVYHLGRIPSPILTKKLKKTSETKGIQKESQDVFTEEDPFSFSEKRGALDKIDETKEIRLNGKEKTKDELHFKATCYKKKPVYETSYLDENKDNLKLEIRKNKEDKSVLWFEKPLVTLLFDYKRWNHPLRYIKNDRFENAVRNEMSQYFFYTCQSDGKLKISFTYLPSLLTFLEMIQRKISLNESALEILSSNKLYNYWIYTNEYKRNKQTNEAINRIEALDKEYLFLDILEKKTRLCNCDKKKKEYLPKRYDPFLNGPFRETTKKWVSPLIINETFWINKIHGILLTDSREFEQKMSYPFDKKSLLKKRSHLLTLIGEFAKEPTPNFNLKGLILFPKERKRSSEDRVLKFLFHVVMTDPNNNHKKPILKKSSGVKGIRKKVSHWSYKLIDELEQQEGGNAEDPLAEDHGIRSRKAKRVIIFTDKQTNTDTYDTYTKQTNDLDQAEEVALIRYSQQSDFRRDIIKGSMRTQRRKTVIRELFQTNIHSPLFLERKDNKLSFLYFEIYELMKFIFRNAMKKNAKLKMKEMEKNKEYKRKEGAWIEIAETWDTILFAQVMRGCLLVTQSILRKYIILPSLIIAKNIGRILLFQSTEWSEDLNQWNREIHIKCTYNGVQLSETEFPKNWLKDGIQIKIIFPFSLKPWYKSKLRFLPRNTLKTKRKKEDFCFLTVWGMEADLPFGPPRKRPSFFEPIFKRLEKKFRKWKNFFFLIIKTKNLSKENKLLKSKKKVYKSSEIKKDSIQKKSQDLKKDLPTENKMKDMIDKKKNEKRVDLIELKLKKLSKGFSEILKKKKSRLIYESKFHFFKFIKYFMKKIYINIFLFLYISIIKISSLNAQLFLDSIKKSLYKYIYNKKKERVDKTNKLTIQFISTIKKLLNNNKNSKILFGLPSFSQTYVFYTLSQIQIIYLDKLRYVLQYPGTSVFLKNVITEFFRTQGIFDSDSKFRHKNLLNYEKKKWKSWLKGYYQYNLSPIIWARLVPKKWRNRVNQHSTIQNKELNKEYLYEKSPLIHHEKQHYYEETFLLDQNFKHYGFDLLSYKSINYENKAASSIYMYGSPLQEKKKRTFINLNTDKMKLFYMVRNIPINNFFNNYRRYDNIRDRDMEKKLNTKYLDCQILYFSLKKKVDIFDKKSFFYLTIYQKKDNETLSRSISNMEFWFLQKFVLLYKNYKIESWIIPIKLLFFDFSEKVKKKSKKKKNFYIIGWKKKHTIQE
uniref:Protein TIC 214 n=1 Tax=Lysiana exocarpi TaxID=50144 RepID=A0AA96RND5_9MAGN|nr:Ycf1 protein [Lysiana exocarpi]WNR57377.1 Ycf1 protein [Lysiana exocarpi]WNR57442.1 Ycf1 protein [Lysiana exocarpi]